MNYFLNRYKRWGKEINPKEVTVQKAIRVNTLRTNEKELLNRLDAKGIVLTKVPYLKHAYSFDSDFAMSSTPEYLQGYYYLQEGASQFVAEVVDPKPDEVVLDMCAAPGSKTTHLAQLMDNKGTLVALDSNIHRIEALKNNLERMGIKNTTVVRKDAKFADDLEMEFDKIALDAPCSGNFAIEEDWFNKRSPMDIKQVSVEQKKLIKTALAILKPGGTLIYSTCSLEKEENEDVVEYGLEQFNDIVLEDINTGYDNAGDGLTDKTKGAKRFWPKKNGTQGFFIAKLKRLPE